MMHLAAQISEKINEVLQDDVALGVADSVANKTTIGGGGLVVLGGYTLNEWLMILGGVLGVAGFIVDIWFKRRRLKLLEDQLKCERGKIDETE